VKRPHIIIFNPDQFRADCLGHLGNQGIHTPNLDNLCKTEGVSFRNAFCQNPVCTPSRCSFMSGWYPHVRGHRTMFHMMHEEEPVLLKTLKEEGYLVFWGGKNDLIPGQGSFEDYCNIKHKPGMELKPDLHHNQSWRGKRDSDDYYSFYAGKLQKNENEEMYYDKDWDNVLSAIKFIESAPKDQPLCIYLPLAYPHPPYGVEEPWYSINSRFNLPQRIPVPAKWNKKPSILKGIYENQKLQQWSEEQWQELKGTYYGMCSRIDHQFGLLMEALKKTGIYDDSAVFFFSDHGDFTGDYGLVEKTQNTFEDALTNVPFVIKPPSWINVRHGISEALVELIDFPATVEELCGIEPKHTHFGRSLLAILEGKADFHRDAVFCEGGRLHGESHCMELESEMHDIPEALYWPRLSLQSGEGPEHTKAVMVRTNNFKYVKRLYESDELYDLEKDPVELNNVIDEPSYLGVLLQLKERLLDFYLETCDVVPHETDNR
jgi:arylsulfatase A-like enzyme